jgi:hypothetical protein
MPRPSLPDESWSRFVAGILARCIPLAEQDSTLAVEKRPQLAKAYEDQAIDFLRQGFHRATGPSMDALKNDPNLAPLRPRTDFQELLRELDAAAGPGKK